MIESIEETTVERLTENRVADNCREACIYT